MTINQILDYMKKTIEEKDRGPLSDPFTLTDEDVNTLYAYLKENRDYEY